MSAAPEREPLRAPKRLRGIHRWVAEVGAKYLRARKASPPALPPAEDDDYDAVDELADDAYAFARRVRLQGEHLSAVLLALEGAKEEIKRLDGLLSAETLERTIAQMGLLGAAQRVEGAALRIEALGVAIGATGVHQFEPIALELKAMAAEMRRDGSGQ